MTKRQRSLQQTLSAIADQASAKLVEIRLTGRNHYQAAFNKGGTTLRMHLSATPGDGARTIKNDAAQARRLLRGVA